VRIYYEDTDAGGVVYYANYLRYMERARTEWLRSLGWDQTGLAREFGILFIVRSATVEYLRPGRLDDALEVTVEPRAGGASSLTITQRVLRGAEEVARGEVAVVCVNTETLRPVRIPAALVPLVGAMEQA
jgi:tol-pal system-associated acyl-CoA thioesterase